MKVFLVLLVVLCSMTSAMKRAADGVITISRPEKRPRTEQVVEVAEFPQLPVELFMEIFQHILDGLSLKRTLRDPMNHYFSISKFWNTQLSSTNFQNFLWSHPRFALLRIKRRFDISSPFLVKLLQTASSLVDMNAAIKLLLRAKTGNEIKELSKLPVFQFELSLPTLNMHLKYAWRHGYLKEIIPVDEDDLMHNNARSAIKRNLATLDHSLNHQFCLDKDSALDLVKIMFLEDLYKPFKFTGIYQFACEMIYNTYHEFFGVDVENHLVDALRGLILPISGLEALWTTIIKDLFMAAFIGDRDYPHIILPNFDANSENLEDVACNILPIIQSFHNGEIDEFPAKDILLVKQIIKHRFGHPLRNFEQDLVQERKQKIQDDDSVNDVIKRLVQIHI